MPLLPGVHTCGDTLEEVKINIREAVNCHLQKLLKDNKHIPQEGEVLEEDFLNAL